MDFGKKFLLGLVVNGYQGDDVVLKAHLDGVSVFDVSFFY